MLKILFVDSDWRFVIQARDFLESRGNVAVSVSADQASRRILAWQPDVVILSADHATTDLLNQIAALPDRPAVLLTEQMSRYDRAWQAWQRGGDELLMKPVLQSSDLHEAIIIAIQRAETQPQWQRQQQAISA